MEGASTEKFQENCRNASPNVISLQNQHQQETISWFLFFLLLCWVFVVVDGLSLVAESKGYSSLWCYGLLIAVAFLVAEHRL